MSGMMQGRPKLSIYKTLSGFEIIVTKWDPFSWTLDKLQTMENISKFSSCSGIVLAEKTPQKSLHVGFKTDSM